MSISFMDKLEQLMTEERQQGEGAEADSTPDKPSEQASEPVQDSPALDTEQSTEEVVERTIESLVSSAVAKLLPEAVDKAVQEAVANIKLPVANANSPVTRDVSAARQTTAARTMMERSF